MKIPISDIFVSYQGEGLFVGTKNLFIRFGGCNLSCIYCDEKKNKYKLLDSNKIINFVEKSIKKDKAIKIISFTGGEPLLYADFLKDLINSLKGRCLFLLETNSVLVENLKMIINHIDIISADIKLPQYCGGNFFDLHREFLRISSKKTVYVKVVFYDDIFISDFKKAVEIVSSVDEKIVFFIQPETKSFKKKKYFNLVDKLYNIASKRLFNVRFLPQVHRYLGIK